MVGRKSPDMRIFPLSNHARKYACDHCHSLHFAHETKASAIDSVGQVGGASLNATKKLRGRLTLTEARLINSNAS
jgi:hypothetical protein